jgi:undecaprenyl-diphosphatase
MDWLLANDTALFHFLNTAFVNPLFDRLMPALSVAGYSNYFFLALVIVALPVMVWLGSVRLRVCLVMMVLVVALGDPLVVGMVKDTVQRPRPFVVLKDARVYVPLQHQAKPVKAWWGRTYVLPVFGFDTNGINYVAPLPDGALPKNANRHSFPSAHAANCSAVAVVGLLYFRRRAWWLFLLAFLVAFSRIYNGVHYPGDVLAGGLLGAGYAVAMTVLLQMLWNVFGKKFFPQFHARLPNLLQPETIKAESGKRKAEK